MPQRRLLQLLLLMLLGAVSCMAIIASTVFVADPFQYFRKARDPQFSELMQRYQAPGIIRNYSFDEIVVGSSTVANLKSSLFGKLGNPSVQNLSFWGGTLNEAYNAVQLSLRAHKLKAVYWAIDPVLVLRDFRYPDFPQCMYDHYRQLLPYCYLFNRGILNEAIASRFPRIAVSRAGWSKELDDWKKINAAPLDAKAFGCEIAQRLGRSRPLEVGRLDQMKQKFSALVLDTIRTHPDTHFNIIFPPLYAPELWLRAHDNPEHLPFIEWAAKQIVMLPNASVFDFQLATDITRDEHRYRDALHANPDIAALMAEWLTSGNYQLGPLDLDAASAARRKLLDEQAMIASRFPARGCHGAS